MRSFLNLLLPYVYIWPLNSVVSPTLWTIAQAGHSREDQHSPRVENFVTAQATLQRDRVGQRYQEKERDLNFNASSVSSLHVRDLM